MKKDKLKNIDFYFITDSNLTKNGIISDVKEAINAGCKIIQYREKNKNIREMLTEVKEIKNICKDKCIFLINDHIDVAKAADADGVHLGKKDTPIENARKILGNDKIIGLTVHNEKEAIEAVKKGADYIAVSPIFETKTKSDAGKAVGIGMIKKIKEKVNLPIVAIGGINKNNVAEAIKAGADAIVAISAVYNSDNIFQGVEEMIHIIKKVKSKEDLYD